MNITSVKKPACPYCRCDHIMMYQVQDEICMSCGMPIEYDEYIMSTSTCSTEEIKKE